MRNRVHTALAVLLGRPVVANCRLTGTLSFEDHQERAVVHNTQVSPRR